MGLKVEVKDEGSWKRVLEIQVPVEEVQSELDKLVAEFQRRTVIPGFRKGKAPKDLLELRFGHSLHSEFIERILPKFYREALKETNLVPVSQAELDDFKFVKGEPLFFRAKVEVWPDIEVRGYEGLEVVKENHDVTDEDLEKELARLQEMAAALVPVQREAREADFLVVDFVRLGKEGKPIRKSRREGVLIDMSSPTLLKDFRNGLLGVSVGEERVISVEYPAGFPDKDLAGQSVKISVKVREVKEKSLPPIDGEFAKNYGGVGTLEELKSRIRINLEAGERLRAKEALEDRIVDELISVNPFELPQTMVTEAIDDLISMREKETGALSPEAGEKVRELYMPIVVRNLKRNILISSIARKESLDVKDEEIKFEVDRIASEEGKEVGEVENELSKGNGLGRLRNALFQRKILDFLVSKANVKEVDVKKHVERLIKVP